MKFDWSMVKGKARTDYGSEPPPPPPREIPRFELREGSYPVSVDAGLPLLDFIEWCVPYDRSQDLGAIGRLYESLAEEEVAQSPPAPR